MSNFGIIKINLVTLKHAESKDPVDLSMYSWGRRKMIRFRASITGYISITWKRKKRFFKH